jgi:hypothetical protein
LIEVTRILLAFAALHVALIDNEFEVVVLIEPDVNAELK